MCNVNKNALNWPEMCTPIWFNVMVFNRLIHLSAFWKLKLRLVYYCINCLVSFVICHYPVYLWWCWQNVINSLTHGRFEWNLRLVIFKLILIIGGWDIFCKIALRWMSLDLIDDKSTLVQVMVWCCQATSHYLSQCWPRSMSPYGVTRPQWVNDFSFGMCP